MSRLTVCVVALVLLVGASCTSHHQRAGLVRSSADGQYSNDSTTSTSLATGPGDQAVQVAPDNDPTPVLVHAARTSRSAAGPSGPPAVSSARAVAPAAPPPVRGPLFPNPAPGPENYAVVIGITAYQGGTHHTVGGAGDAAAFMQLLRRQGWDPSHIVQLVDGNATGANMRTAMQWLVDHSTPTSFSLFHYSGHVCQSNTGPCGAGHYLWSVDNRMISMTDFGNVMRGIRGQAWVDIAGCEAADFEQGIHNSQRLFTAASQTNEKGYENPDWHESVWTGLLVDQGMLQGKADTNGDHRVSLQEAAGWAAAQAPGMTTGQAHSPQHPMVVGGDSDGGAWSLAYGNPTNRPAPPPPPNGGGSGGGGSQPAPPPNKCGGLTNGLVKC